MSRLLTLRRNLARLLTDAEVDDNFVNVATDFTGSTDPAGLAGANILPYMRWADTGTGWLKRRNAANTGWVSESRLLRPALQVFSPSEIPTTNIGDIYVDGVGWYRWSGSSYTLSDPVRAVVQRGPGSGSWTTTVPQFFIDACAGGGGGGGGSGYVGDTFRLQGGGGGAGECLLGEVITAPVGTLLTWTVGSGGGGGAGGAVSGAGAAGAPGTNTVIVIQTSPVQTITLTRGMGGLPGATGGPALGGAGYPAGGAGFAGATATASTWPQTGAGGSSAFGGGGPGVASLSGPVAGINGAGYGSAGGGGACPSTAGNIGGKGGDGRGGFLKIYW